jgi:adenine-specific DNA methylase
MACRRRPDQASVGWYAQVRASLEQVVRERLQAFWQAGIRGADFFVSAIGPAVGVFGKYRKVMRPDGSELAVGQLLEETREIVSAFALAQMGIAQLDEPTRFYILYRWAYGGDALSFDEANKLAKSAGAELDALAEECLVARTRDVVHVPIFAERVRHTRFKNSIQQAVDDGKFATLPEIDQLHLLLYLWRRGETELLSSLLGRGGILSEEHPLWRTAQALLEVEQSHAGDALHEEATALAQLLGSKRSLLRQAEQAHAASQQGKLFE